MATIPKAIREAEATALRQLYERITPPPNQAAFAKKHGLGTSSMVYQYTTDRRPLNLDIATKFARALGVPIEAFSPRLAALAMSARDASHAHMAPAAAAAAPPVAREQPPSAWPFSSELLDAVADLSPTARRRLENSVRVQLDMPTLQATQAPASAARPKRPLRRA